MLQSAQTSIACNSLAWSAEFVDESMADIAFIAVMAGEVNFGDSPRVVTDAAFLYPLSSMLDLDGTTFWRQEHNRTDDVAELSTETIIALTKFFVLKWSITF